MAYFPMFVDLTGKRVLVIGGGAVAARRIQVLLEFGCSITVISPKLCGELSSLYKGGQIAVLRTEYQEKSLEAYLEEDKKNPPVFVLAAAIEPVNEQAAGDCRKRGIPVNNASKKEQSDFYFPGIVKDRETVIGITSGGLDHKKAAAVTAAVGEALRIQEHGKTDLV